MNSDHIFDEIDTDHGGTITCDELKRALDKQFCRNASLFPLKLCKLLLRHFSGNHTLFETELKKHEFAVLFEWINQQVVAYESMLNTGSKDGEVEKTVAMLHFSRIITASIPGIEPATLKFITFDCLGEDDDKKKHLSFPTFVRGMALLHAFDLVYRITTQLTDADGQHRAPTLYESMQAFFYASA